MTVKETDSRIMGILAALKNYAVFFAVAAFAVTCCMLLFLSTMIETTGVELTEDAIQKAAKLTFVNVMVISLIFLIIDLLRRKITVDRPVKRIVSMFEKIMQGDFGVRIERFPFGTVDSGFNTIIDYINRSAEELSHVETLRTDFIADVSHELKTPLSVIRNYAVLLSAKDISDENRAEYAGAVIAASKKLTELITNILKLNKLENQQIFPSCEAYNLGEQLCECLLGFENEWEKRQMEIETDIEEDIYVSADPELFSLVWNNLLSNAFKFTEDGGKITVALHADKEYASVSVSDTGCGLKPETGGRIFEKFYQEDSSRSSRGNGLGLALVKRVADIMKAEIDVESEYGKGSTFTVRIPR